MKNSDTKIRLGILAIIALAMLALLGFGWISIKKENRQTADLMAASGASESAEREEQAIRAIQAESSDEIKALEALALTNDKLVPLIEDIESLGSELGLDLEIASVEKKEAEGSSPQLIRIAVSAKGSWGGVLALLQAVESLPYRVIMESANLNKGTEKWDETLVFSVHSFK